MKNIYVVSGFGNVCFNGKLFKSHEKAEKYVKRHNLARFGIIGYYSVDRREIPMPVKPRRIHYMEYPE